MKLKVAVYALNTEAVDEERGEIVWDGEKMTASNDSVLLKNIIELPIGAGGKKLFAKDDPELFMRSLHIYYTSPYLRVSKARRADRGARLI